MSDQSQQEENEEVEETKQPDPLEGFSDVERELSNIVEQRKADKKKERLIAKRIAEGKLSVDTPADDTSEDTAGDETGTLDESLVPASDQPSPDETGGVAAGQEGQQPLSTTPPSATPPSDADQGTDTQPFTYRFRDTDFDEQTIQNGLELKAWADSLPQEAQQGINAYLSGEAVLVPRVEYERIQKGSQPNAPSQTQTTPETQTPPVLTDDDLAELPPAVATMLRNQQQQLAEHAQWREQQEKQSNLLAQQQYQQNLRSTIDKVVGEVKAKYALTDEEFEQLDNETGKSGQVARLAVAYGDPERALREAFDNNYARMFQAREIARQQTAIVAGQQVVNQQQSKVKSRKANAAALNPAGNSVPSGNTRPSTPEEKRQARVADIAEILMQGG